MIVRIVMAITVASRWRMTHLNMVAGVTLRPTSAGGAEGAGERSPELAAACAKI
jgi:hypothetical protein